MKSDLLNLITSDYDLTCGIVGDEVVNYNKINTHLYQTVRNLVGEFSESDSYLGEGSIDSRLTDQSTEVEISLNEKFNDYIGNEIYSGSGNHAEGTLNKLWGDFSTINNHVEGSNNYLISGGNFQFGRVYRSESDVTTDDKLVDYFQAASSHIEGTNNKNFFSKNSHVEGSYNTVTIGQGQHIEGMSGTAYGDFSHVEGFHGLPNSSVSYNINLTGNLLTDTPTLFNSIDAIRIQENDLNNPNYDVLPTPNYLTLLASKSTDLTHAIANQFMQYTYSSQNGIQLINPSKGIAFGKYSHIEGQSTSSFGMGSHAEGQNTSTLGDYSHAEGQLSHAFGKGAHAEGGYNIAGSFAILNDSGKDITFNTRTYDSYSIVDYFFMDMTEVPSENNTSKLRFVFEDSSIGNSLTGNHNSEYQIKTGYQHNTSGEGNYLDTSNSPYGKGGIVSGLGFFGVLNYYSGVKGYQHAEGYKNVAFGDLSHVEGYRNWAINPGVHVEGYNNFSTVATLSNSSLTKFSRNTLDVTSPESTYDDIYGGHVEGTSNGVFGLGSYHVEGFGNGLTGERHKGNHIEGAYNRISSSTNSDSCCGCHVEGYYNSSSSGNGNHTEGCSYLYPSVSYSYNNSTGRWTRYDGQTRTFDSGSPYSPISISPGSAYGSRSSYGYTVYSRVTGGGTTNTNYSYYYGNYAGSGNGNHAEGYGSYAYGGSGNHAEGTVYVYTNPTKDSYYTSQDVYARYYYFSKAGSGDGHHAEGAGCVATSGMGNHAEGCLTCAYGGNAHHSEGFNVKISGGTANHTEGYSNYITGGSYTHVEGTYNYAAGDTACHIEGASANYNTPTGSSLSARVTQSLTNSAGNDFGNEIIRYTSLLNIINGTTPGSTTTLANVLSNSLSSNSGVSTDSTTGQYYLGSSHTGMNYLTGATACHIEGLGNSGPSGGLCTHSEGICNSVNTAAVGAHIEGICNDVEKAGGHAEGIGTSSDGMAAHSEGIGGKAKGKAAHSEGYHCECHSIAGHAEGYESIVATNSMASHVEGYSNAIVSAQYAHCGGAHSRVNGDHGFAHGLYVTAGTNQIAFGKYNDVSAPNAADIMFMIGNGTSDSTRSNIFELDKNGNLSITGDIVFNGNLTLSTVLEEIRNSGGGSGGGGSYRNAETTRY